MAPPNPIGDSSKANPSNTVVMVVGDEESATSLTDSSIVISGFNGHSTASTDGIAICGGYNRSYIATGTATIKGQYGFAYAKGGTATVETGGCAVVRDGGVAISGNGGVALALAHDQHPGVATTGENGGIAISLMNGTVNAQGGSLVIIRYLDPDASNKGTWKFAIGYIGKKKDAPKVQVFAAGQSEGYQFDGKELAPLKRKKK